ncbi:putative Membrane Spanning Protein [Granulibacter bethesdensis]|nr:putative Membrane Spanning Protein [Granulibacter bethesdensis]
MHIVCTKNVRFCRVFSGMRRFLIRHQPSQPARAAILAGIGGLLGVGSIGAAAAYSELPMLIAPFGASSVLLFSVPHSPLSQPVNVIGGHLVSTLTGLALLAILPNTWWAASLGVGLAIALMTVLRMTHPPAGANPLVIFALNPDMSFAFVPILTGSCALIAIAACFHKLSGTPYPVLHSGNPDLTAKSETAMQ